MSTLQLSEDSVSQLVQITRLWADRVAQISLVQAIGTVDGFPFYFHARGNSWSFSVAPTPNGDPIEVSLKWSGIVCAGNPSGYYEEQPYGSAPPRANEAGRMPLEQASSLIQRAARNYLQSAPKASSSL